MKTRSEWPLPGQADDPLAWPGRSLKGRLRRLDRGPANGRNRRYLVVAVRSGEGSLNRTYNGHSGPTAGTGLHAPQPTFDRLGRNVGGGGERPFRRALAMRKSRRLKWTARSAASLRRGYRPLTGGAAAFRETMCLASIAVHNRDEVVRTTGKRAVRSDCLKPVVRPLHQPAECCHRDDRQRADEKQAPGKIVEHHKLIHDHQPVWQ